MHSLYNARPCSVHIVHGVIRPIVCNHYTHLEGSSLFFPQKFGQKSEPYTQQKYGTCLTTVQYHLTPMGGLL